MRRSLMTNKELTIIQNMLEKSEKIHIAPNNSDLNYFNIAGYPHYENVVSNILQFFFNTDKPHGFKDLWVKSLIECCKEKNALLYEPTTKQFVTNNVIREYETENSKRIDLVIESDEYVITIENKIYAKLDNPLQEYEDTINRDYGSYKDIKQKLYIVLSIHKQVRLKRGWINIQYTDFINQIKKNIEQYTSDVEEKWIIFANEFMDNLLSMCKEESSMDKELNAFLYDNNDEIKVFLDKYNKAMIEKDNYLSELDKEFDSDSNIGFKHGTYKVNTVSKNHFYSSVYINIPDDNTFSLETYIMNRPDTCDFCKLGKIYISLWHRSKHYVSAAIQEKLTDCGYNLEKACNTNCFSNWGNFLIVKTYNIGEISCHELASELKEISNLIKDTLNVT